MIFYVTAIAAEDGHTHFFDDLYGYDQKLQQVLCKGPPYPVKPDPTDAHRQARRHCIAAPQRLTGARLAA